tara:strand:+ start:7577 stop:7813 length:237 start_codon:yes stop_codon:yes gene_type:complete
MLDPNERLAAIYDCEGDLWKYDFISEEHRIWLMETLGYRATYISKPDSTHTTTNAGDPTLCPNSLSSIVPYNEAADTA